MLDTDLSRVLFVSSTSKHESNEIYSKYETHGCKNDKGFGCGLFSQPFPNFVKVDGIGSHKNPSTKRWKMCTETVQISFQLCPSNLDKIEQTFTILVLPGRNG